MLQINCFTKKSRTSSPINSYSSSVGKSCLVTLKRAKKKTNRNRQRVTNSVEEGAIKREALILVWPTRSVFE